MEEYTIKKAYHWTKDKELEIKSDTLIYTELGEGSGCQSKSMKNNSAIHVKCVQIAILIREIETLNSEE